MTSKAVFKIELNRIPSEGLRLDEEISAKDLDVEQQFVQVAGLIKVSGMVSRITNAVTAALTLSASLKMSCGRCLEEFERGLKKDIQLNYSVESSQRAVDLTPDIREEMILAYPMVALCSEGCKGLCPKCGHNLNKEKCNCSQ